MRWVSSRHSPGAATVIASKSSSVFLVSKLKFEVLIKKFPNIGFVIYRNIIQILSERLGTTNKQLVTSQKNLSEIREKGDVLSI